MSLNTVERKFSLNVPSSTENLELIREFVSGLSARAGLAEAEIGKVKLAVDEACANVIEHAYGHDASKEVLVRVSFDSEYIRVEIEDTGKRFDPSQVEPKELERLVAERKKGGLGLQIMRKFMDEVHFGTEQGKNSVRLVKKIKK